MKRITFIIILSLSVLITYSQTGGLKVISGSGNNYLLHKVMAKENWYSIGRLYNISPKELAPFNNLNLQHALSIGEELKIPLTNVNFTQSARKSADESLVPVYHVSGQDEKLSQVSALYNHIPVASLQKWNKIQGIELKEGSPVIIGFLRVKTQLSALANKASLPESQFITQTPKPVPSGTVNGSDIASSDNMTTSETKSTPTSYSTSGSTSTYHANGGYFRGDFNDGGNKATGTAGTFKSTSGWNDGKYYILVNNIPVGTIVKIIAPATQKSVYAKVLGQLPDMKESEGLLLRISNSAVSELAEADGRFGVQVRY